MGKENKHAKRRAKPLELEQQEREKPDEEEVTKASEKPPRRRSARLIAISKPSAKEEPTNGDISEKEFGDQFGVLEDMADSSNEPDISMFNDRNNSSDSSDYSETGKGRRRKRRKREGEKKQQKKSSTDKSRMKLSLKSVKETEKKTLIPLPNRAFDERDSLNSSGRSSLTAATAISSTRSSLLFTLPSSSSSSTGLHLNGIDLSNTPSTSSSSNLLLHLPTISHQAKTDRDHRKAEPFSGTSDDGGEEDWEQFEALDTRWNEQEKDVVEVHLEGKAAEKFKSEMNPLEAKNEKEAKEREKWEHWMRLEVERRRKELQEDLHRIHFLTHIAHLRFLISSLVQNRARLSGQLSSLLGPSIAVPVAPTQMRNLLDVFRTNLRCRDDPNFSAKPNQRWCINEETVASHLSTLIDQRGFNTDREIALLFFIYCAFVLELPTRLCLAFTPMPRLVKMPKYLKKETMVKKRIVKKKGVKDEKMTAEVEKNMKKAVQTKRKSTRRTGKKAGKDTKEEETTSSEESSSEDEWEEEEEDQKRRKRNIKNGKNIGGNNLRTIGSRVKKEKKADEEEDGKQTEENGGNKDEDNLDMNDKKKQTCRVYWNEYWDELEQRWIYVDAFFNDFDSPKKMEEKMGKSPPLYVLAIDNDMGVREIAAKYAANFLALETRKLRTDEEWLRRKLEYPFLRANRARARLEDAAILEQLKSKPLPVKLNEYKNHPLYALKKDLLKFDAIYPADTVPVGRIRDHASFSYVYPRSAVHKLEGSLNWIKESRSIKAGEKPYKVVDARPKLNVPKEKRVPLSLDLFGFWQTEPYRAPEVQDGRIPRNEFGNLYMYKKEMLPKGCAHLRLPGIFQLARRFDLEAVPAVVGWEFSGGFNHPILDGCVVLQKDEEVLRSAWQEMARNKAVNETKKSNERVWKNWRRLIRGKLLLEQMRHRFK